MDDEKKIIEKRSSLRGWKERNRGKSNQKIYIMGVVIMSAVFLTLIIYSYIDKKNDISIPIIGTNSSNGSDNSSLIKATPEKTTPKKTAAVTPGTAKNITGKMNTPFVLDGFEITVKSAGSTVLHTNVWIVAKNKDSTEKQFKIDPSTVVIDNMGEQYENIHVQRSSEIKQTTLTANATIQGSIFFGPLREGRSPKRMILNINGQKADIMLEK